MNTSVGDYLSKIGKKGGLKTSINKKASSALNGKKGKKPHFIKIKHFLKTYPYVLEDNEWKEKFPVGKTKTGRIATYNPDYFCRKTQYYIEVATSKPNISEQGWKWSEAIKRGVKLKVFWWEGGEITKIFKR